MSEQGTKGWLWLQMLAILMLERLRQEDSREYEANLS